MNFEVYDFQKQVLERSHEVPVVVDFWAPWCGPCQMLGPTIEKLASEADGRWELVKVNTEINTQTAQEWGIRGIPNVKFFSKGKVASEFSGAMPEATLRRWIEDHLPRPEAEVLRETWFREDADWTLLDGLRNSPEYAMYHDLREWLQTPYGETPVCQKLAGAAMAAQHEDFSAAIEQLISALVLNKEFGRELPRRATVALFQWLGSDHHLTAKFQRRFSMALYA